MTNVADEAIKIVAGPRQEAYGDKLRNFSDIAALWEPILGTTVTPEQVALCMMQVKISRLLKTTNHHDSLVDICGYALCYESIIEERKPKVFTSGEKL